MATTTALTIVNRVLRKHRIDDVATFTEVEAKLALDLVNEAIRDLLSTRDYPWNVRSDGVLVTQAQVSGASLSLTAGSTAFSDTSVTSASEIADGSSRGVCHLIPTGSSEYADTGFRLASAQISSGTLIGVLATAWPGATQSGLTCTYMTYEYVLPDTVAKVISVNHQGTPVNLIEVEPHKGFDEIVPKPHETTSDTPEVVAVGGSSSATYDSSSASVGANGLRFMLWPVPITELVLHYSYKERIADLVSTTDTLVAPSEFVDDVVKLADALSYHGAFGNDPELARINSAMAMSMSERKYGNSAVDPSRRFGIRPADSGVSRRGWPGR